MADYPVIFSLRDAVSGNGFLAGITLTGYALMTKESDEKWWMYGVRPGAIAECGATPEEAFLRFRNTYKNILFDFAEDNVDYSAFRQTVENFYYQADEEEEERWQQAFNAIRSKTFVPDDEFFGKLPKEAPETRPTQLNVVRLDAQAKRYRPTDNAVDYVALAKAA
jgi:hypothetical protein